jgi:ribonucleoside-diphosphate reductase alpha chain
MSADVLGAAARNGHASPRLAPTTVVKRDGRTAPYARDKIARAVARCLENDLGMAAEGAAEVGGVVAGQVEGCLFGQASPGVERVQDLVEQQLMANGLHEAARAYILFRDARRKERQERPVDPETAALFRGTAKYFTGLNGHLQLAQAFDKFCRFDWSKGRREVWPEAVDRVMAYARAHMARKHPGVIDEALWAELGSSLLNLEVAPSMRLVQMAGAPLDRCQVGVYNCLGRDTEFVTSAGVKSFADFEDGDHTVVLTHRGRWRDAVVRYYGEKPLHPVTVRRGRTAYTYQATRDHRWLLRDGRETTSLSPGDSLVKTPAPLADWSYEAAEPLEKLYWAYGFVYADGTLVKNAAGEYAHSMVRLCGPKAEYLPRFEELGFGSSRPLSCGGDPYAYTGTYLKTLPSLGRDGVALTRAFVRGWLDADGAKVGDPTNRNPFKSIQVTGEDRVAFVRAVFPAVGAYISREADLTGQETNYGVREDQTVLFGLICGFGDAPNSHFSCAEVGEPVTGGAWCLEVEEDHSFVLKGGVVTGNCAFLFLDSPTAYAEDLYCLMQGTGVGFSVEHAHAVDKWPRVKKQRKAKPDRYVIPDTTEGWCDSFKHGIERWLDGGDYDYDDSQIRKAGTILRTKGGRASGPQPLRDLLTFARGRMLARQGDRLTSLDLHDMACMSHRIVQMGGVRRASGISFSDLDDALMRDAKSGTFWNAHPYRNQANDSAVYDEKPSALDFMAEWLSLARSGSGERGIFNAGSLRRQMPRRRKRALVRSNPCGEINLRHDQFCNLSIAVLRRGMAVAEVRRRVRLAAVWGTIQATMTDFAYLNPLWKANCEEERLLGVDLLGHLDCELTRPGAPGLAGLLESLKQDVIAENARLSGLLGVNPSAAVTCGKPSGDSSCFFDTAAGFKAWHGRHYIRRLRFADHNPVAKVLAAAGVPYAPDYDKSGLLVFDFPCRAPEGAILLGDQTALEQLEHWKTYKLNFTEHNPSVTVYVKPDEWLAVGHWVYENWDSVGGLAFLPYDGGVYPLAPYETITEEEYARRAAEFPEIDWAKLPRFEDEDMTTLGQQFACVGGACELA